jgi:hypothetical protein
LLRFHYSCGMPQESTQEDGRKGVAFTKRWLEATTFLELPWNAYEDSGWCFTALLKGGRKMYDLSGFFLGESRQRVFVENKAENTPGHQTAQYSEFLANAYSATAQETLVSGAPTTWEFFWVTSHPFGAMTNWSNLATKAAVIAAVAEHDVLPDGEVVDTELAAKVAGRTWLLVVSRKQERLALDRSELDQVLHTLQRKKPTL